MTFNLNDLVGKYNIRIDLPLHVYAAGYYSKLNEDGGFANGTGKVLTQKMLLNFIYKNRRMGVLRHIGNTGRFNDIPYIDKQFLRDNRDKYFTTRACRNSWLKLTSGTTGRPVEILYSSDFYFNFLYEDIPVLLRKYDKGLINYDNSIFCMAIVNDRESPNEVIRHPESKTGFILKIVVNENDDNSISDLLVSIETFKPEVLTIKPSLCEAITGYLKKNNTVPQYSPKAIIVSGANFETELREELSVFFKSEIIELYGMTEFGIIAYECKYKKGLHICSDRVFYEVLEPDTTNSHGDKMFQRAGELVLSCFKNTALPLIRYRTGDLVTIDERKCECGNIEHRIVKLHGRKGSCFRFSKGDILSPNQFNGLFQISPLIKEFQVLQKGPENLILRLMTLNNNRADEPEVLKFLKGIIPGYVKVDLLYEDIVYDSKFERFVIE